MNIPLSVNMITSIDHRIDRVTKDLQEVVSEALVSEESRKKLLSTIMTSMTQIESPAETIWRMIMSPHAPAALNALLRAGVVDQIVTSGPYSAKELGELCNVDPALIVRLMRPLTALGIFAEGDVEEYASTSISKTLTAPPIKGGYQFMFECATRSLALMPSYLERTGYQNVTSSPGPFEYAHNTSDGMFSYLNKNPLMMSNFNAFMAGNLHTRKNWFERFPAAEILLNKSSRNPDDVLLVDVAGNQGHDIESFHRKFPNQPGRLILQDLPQTIENIKQLDPAIETQKYDFFTTQPVAGARGYYFRYIFHDWPDHQVVDIMRNTAAAMKRGYSKILIFEWILPDKGVPLYPALLDINMMAVLNGQERTREHWTRLLNAAGLRATKFWKSGEDAEGLIEVELQ